MSGNGLLAELRAVLGDERVLTAERLRSVSYDDYVGPVDAAMLVRPADAAQLSAVLRICQRRGQTVVPHGGLTGLVFGATARESDLIVSLAAMDRIEELDPAGRTMRVQAGVTLQRVQEEAAGAGLMFPLDLGARGSATIGGNISTNAGGVRVLRYGMMRSLVVGLEAVLADGTVLCCLNRMLKNNAGYDLKQLFIGSEGTLGIVTRAELRLVARPATCQTALVGCPAFEAMVQLLGMLDARLAGQLSAFEALWPEFYALTTTPPARSAALLPQGHALYVLIEALGADVTTDQERFEEVLAEALRTGLIADAVIATSESQRRALWAPREDVFQAERLGPTYNFDVSLAVRDMPRYLQRVNAQLEDCAPGVRTFVFGHVADGNLHLVVVAGESPDPAAAHAAAARASGMAGKIELSVYQPLAELGGSISAEHGIGLERKNYLSLSRTPAEIATMRLLKRALDPRGILNPGKIIDVH